MIGFRQLELEVGWLDPVPWVAQLFCYCSLPTCKEFHDKTSPKKVCSKLKVFEILISAKSHCFEYIMLST